LRLRAPFVREYCGGLATTALLRLAVSLREVFAPHAIAGQSLTTVTLTGYHRAHPKAHRLRDRTGLCRQGIPWPHAQNPGRVFISGQKRGVLGAIKRELRRRSAIEPVIGHMKAEGHLGRCYLKGRDGDAANVILTAVGYNFRRILAWLRAILRKILIAILRAFITRSALNPAC